jgi:hypothetical protein
LAKDDAAWVHGGADGNQESMHFEADDTIVYQLVPVNEVTWQAADGSGPGNMNGVSCEMTQNAAVWNNPTRRDRAIHISADLMGRIAARLNIAKPEQHWDFNYNDPNRHDCPQLLRHVMVGNQTAWDALYVPQWNKSKADELEHMNGGTVTTTYPIGMDEGIASRLFGSVKGDDKKTYSFNPQGTISQFWLTQGPKWGYPQLVAVWTYGDGRKYFRFSGGEVIWQANETAAPAVL